MAIAEDAARDRWATIEWPNDNGRERVIVIGPSKNHRDMLLVRRVGGEEFHVHKSRFVTPEPE